MGGGAGPIAVPGTWSSCQWSGLTRCVGDVVLIGLNANHFPEPSKAVNSAGGGTHKIRQFPPLPPLDDPAAFISVKGGTGGLSCAIATQGAGLRLVRCEAVSAFSMCYWCRLADFSGGKEEAESDISIHAHRIGRKPLDCFRWPQVW